MSEYIDAVRAEIDKQLGWTPQQVHAEAWDHAVTIALGVVGPILDGWDQRLSDVREEYRKSLESWGRTRERLTADLAETRGKLGEAQGNHWSAREELERSEASRQAWAEEAMRVQEQVHRLLGLLDCVHDDAACWFDHHGGCQAHGFLDLKPGEVCPQKEIGGILKAAADGEDGWSVPQCAVHPEASPDLPAVSVHPEGGTA